jgi:hypothetical protein
MQPKTNILPSSVQTRSDVARMIRELLEFDEMIRQAELRKAQAPSVNHLSVPLRATAEVFKNTLDTTEARQKLAERLRFLHKAAPQIHLSFAVQPPVHAVEKLLAWFRTNAHPATLVQIGLDPSIVVGCRVRTTNRVFDFSFAKLLDDSNAVLEKGVINL